jgi:hypothetical protein
LATVRGVNVLTVLSACSAYNDARILSVYATKLGYCLVMVRSGCSRGWYRIQSKTPNMEQSPSDGESPAHAHICVCVPMDTNSNWLTAWPAYGCLDVCFTHH